MGNMFSLVKKEPVLIIEYDKDICDLCDIGEFIEDEYGNKICNNCFVIHTTMISEFNCENQYFNPYIHVYKKLNHFKEIVIQFQAKQSIKNKFSNEWIELLKSEYDKYPVYSDMLPWEKLVNIKKVLKLMRLSKNYKHMYYIYRLLGNEIITFTYEFEERLMHMFNLIVNEFYNYANPERKYFFNFYYLLSKLFIFLGKPDYVIYIIPMKLQKKIKEQDLIWDKIITSFNI
jgi:hypothetical protein